jgi:hypothetical protein
VAAGEVTVTPTSWELRYASSVLHDSGDGMTTVAFEQSGAKQGIKIKLQICFEVAFDEKMKRRCS